MHVRLPDSHGICLPASGHSAERDGALTGRVSGDLGLNARAFNQARGCRRSLIHQPFNQRALTSSASVTAFRQVQRDGRELPCFAGISRL